MHDLCERTNGSAGTIRKHASANLVPPKSIPSFRHHHQRQITSNPDHTAGLSAGPGFHSVAQALSSVHDSAQPPLREVGTGLSHWSRPASPSATRWCSSNQILPGTVPRRRGGQNMSMGCSRSGDQHNQKRYRKPWIVNRPEKLESDL
ncbi:hypothetical protein SMACR_12828 [Sordaria macrospora]|uniref:Uncharacterized protein n=1 Tax=Sordaria macrospora TaxID=5147 RepID=A0A8S9A8W0_SORMA|nr:hypothetical protein SMACR_12828 [Sordaria macrospora]